MPLIAAPAITAAQNAVTALITFISLHTATTSNTGASEYAGVTRQSVAWSAGANTGALTFSTSGASAVTHAGGWTAVTSGTFELGFPLTSSVTAASITVAAGALTVVAS